MLPPPPVLAPPAGADVALALSVASGVGGAVVALVELGAGVGGVGGAVVVLVELGTGVGGAVVGLDEVGVGVGFGVQVGFGLGLGLGVWQ